MRLWVLLLTAIAVAAADAPPLENTGKPIVVPFECDAQKLDDAGLTCRTADPCHVYLELTGIDDTGTRLFLTGNLHTRTTTLSSITMESSDVGRTWVEPVERMPLTSLEGIQFIDFQRGWIAGENVQSIPRDPFLLITDNGGKSWRRQAVFDDERAGSIEAFWFDSRDNGSLVIDSGLPADRHQLYETTDGGANWTLRRKSSAAISLRGRRTKDEASGWRFHDDARNGTYRIEKQGADSPITGIEFMIEVAVCRGE